MNANNIIILYTCLSNNVPLVYNYYDDYVPQQQYSYNLCVCVFVGAMLVRA